MMCICSISPLKYQLQFAFIVCQPEVHTSPSGIIKSPGYPNEYHNNANCVYNITVQEGKRIKIDFSTFEVEGSSTHCPYDKLIIFEGDSVDPTAKLCGSGAKTFQSRRNKLFMRFTTDGSVTKRGFFGRYETIDRRKFISILDPDRALIYMFNFHTFAYAIYYFSILFLFYLYKYIQKQTSRKKVATGSMELHSSPVAIA